MHCREQSLRFRSSVKQKDWVGFLKYLQEPRIWDGTNIRSHFRAFPRGSSTDFFLARAGGWNGTSDW